MATEIELRVLNIDLTDIGQRLKAAGASFVREGLQRRYVYDVEPGNDKKWMRLRDTGQAVELSVKEITDSEAIDGMQEAEVTVGEFEATNELLELLGFTARSYQENFRSTYRLQSVEIVVDQWPKLAPYIEIEGPGEAAVYETLAALGFDQHEASLKHPVEMYAELGIDIKTVSRMQFDTPPRPLMTS